MYLLLWFTIGFIIIGFSILVVMRKNMQRRIHALQAEAQHADPAKAKPVIWWIYGVVIWGIVSIGLLVWCFVSYFN